jgi:hypothetical protein
MLFSLMVSELKYAIMQVRILGEGLERDPAMALKHLFFFLRNFRKLGEMDQYNFDKFKGLNLGIAAYSAHMRKNMDVEPRLVADSFMEFVV